MFNFNKCRNSNFKVCLTDTARDFGQTIGVSTCHGSLANQVSFQKNGMNWNFEIKKKNLFSIFDWISKVSYRVVNTVMLLMGMLLKNTDAIHLNLNDGNQSVSGSMIKYDLIFQ
jgi:hypothetical protein